MRTLIKAVSRVVTAQAGSCCRCRFPLEDEYGKYEGYESHDNWELWHQDHDNINFEYFLKCTGCGYELAKQYWKDSDGTFVDYTDGIAEDCHESKLVAKGGDCIEHCNDCKQVSVFRINEYQDPFYVDGVRLRECIQCGRYETPQADGFWKEPTVDSRNFPKRLTEREELEEQHGQVWNTKELQQDFTVQGFASPCVVVIRKSDGVKGTLEFIHQPRFYFDFVAG